jgi:hypothetical protein
VLERPGGVERPHRDFELDDDFERAGSANP